MSREPHGQNPPVRAVHFWQAGLFGTPLAVVGLLTLFLGWSHPTSTRLLWEDPLGQRMCLATAGWIVICGAICVVGVGRLNRWASRSRWGPGQCVVLTMLLLVWLVGVCLPAADVVAIGPAAIHIQRNLLTE